MQNNSPVMITYCLILIGREIYIYIYIYKDQESYVLDTSQWTDNQNNEDIKLSLNP